MATVVIADPLELDFGVSFARFRVPFAPRFNGGRRAAAAKTESSNAVVSTLRYHQRWGSEHDSESQELNASYSISSATDLLDTDRNFTRQMAKARYKYRHAHHTVELGFLSGKISGDAPLYERFVLGDSTTLRGWNKFDLDPLGGSHVAHGSIDYGYRVLQVFYDAGAVWDRLAGRQNNRSGWDSRRRDFNSPWHSRCARAGRSDFLCRDEFLRTLSQIVRAIKSWWLVLAFLSGFALAMWAEEVILNWRDNRLEFSAPRVHF